MSEENTKYNRAKQRVEDIKGFYIHLAVYVIVNLFLFLINKFASPDSLWFFWPLLGWGVALIIHACTTFLFRGRAIRDWEERKIKEEMEKE